MMEKKKRKTKREMKKIAKKLKGEAKEIKREAKIFAKETKEIEKEIKGSKEVKVIRRENRYSDSTPVLYKFKNTGKHKKVTETKNIVSKLRKNLVNFINQLDYDVDEINISFKQTIKNNEELQVVDCNDKILIKLYGSDLTPLVCIDRSLSSIYIEDEEKEKVAKPKEISSDIIDITKTTEEKKEEPIENTKICYICNCYFENEDEEEKKIPIKEYGSKWMGCSVCPNAKAHTWCKYQYALTVIDFEHVAFHTCFNCMKLHFNIEIDDNFILDECDNEFCYRIFPLNSMEKRSEVITF